MRLATFNCENLFARYKFRKNYEYDPVESDGFTINNLAFDIYDETAKTITARAIREVDADIIALQEIESLPVLDCFNSRYLASMKYLHRILVDSHDTRGIDIALLSRYPIISIRSYRHEKNAANTAFLFSRDNLEVILDVNKKTLVLYVNHFKSMVGGREQTRSRRVEQCTRVADIINSQWKSKNYKGNFVVLGDFNDYLDDKTSLTPLLEHPGLVNVIERLPEKDQWTHYYAGGDEYKQLDYLLLSKSLAQSNKKAPGIMRKGLPYRAAKYSGDRFDQVGEANPKASDHAPLFMDLTLD